MGLAGEVPGERQSWRDCARDSEQAVPGPSPLSSFVLSRAALLQVFPCTTLIHPSEP